MHPELRVHPRHTPVQTAYAALGPAFSKVGRIRDFSQGGLSFEYIDSKVENGENDSVDVFIVDDLFHIHNLSCQVVYDYRIDEENKSENLRKRRCGLRFLSPQGDQQSQIELFLSDYILPPKH